MSEIAIGIDIGGTKVCACAIKDNEIISEIVALKTPKTSQDILDTVFKTIAMLKEKHNATCVGIASAGTVNLENSKVTGSTGNMPKGYSDLEFKKLIKEKFNLETFVENDANAAAYAEYKSGAAKGDENIILLTLGTGIGGGVIINGNILRGKSGVGAECGHIPLSPNHERRCTCGAWDCFEAYASGTGFGMSAKEAAKKDETFKTSYLKDRNPDELSSYDILEGLNINQNDKFCKKIYDNWQNYLLMGMTALVNIFDPDSVVLSGGLGNSVDYDFLEKELHNRTVISKPRVIRATLANNAGMVGAGILAIKKFNK